MVELCKGCGPIRPFCRSYASTSHKFVIPHDNSWDLSLCYHHRFSISWSNGWPPVMKNLEDSLHLSGCLLSVSFPSILSEPYPQSNLLSYVLLLWKNQFSSWIKISSLLLAIFIFPFVVFFLSFAHLYCWCFAWWPCKFNCCHINKEELVYIIISKTIKKLFLAVVSRRKINSFDCILL